MKLEEYSFDSVYMINTNTQTAVLSSLFYLL